MKKLIALSSVAVVVVAGFVVAHAQMAKTKAPEGAKAYIISPKNGDTVTSRGRALMRIYNRKGVFSNAADTLPDLRAALDQRFGSVEITVVGCVALFVAREPR